MKLAIVGSGTIQWGDATELVDLIEQTLIERAPELLISGGANGIDKIAERVAKGRGVPRVIFHPGIMSWSPLEGNGFKARNILAATYCTDLLRIYDVNTKSYGSGWTADYAEKLGRKVERIPFQLKDGIWRRSTVV